MTSEVNAEIKRVAFKSVDDILDFAIKSEENANRFYSEFAKKLEKKAIQGVFHELADEENKHKEFLLEVKAGNKVTPTQEEITDLKISDYMVDMKASLDMDYQEALILSMHREKMAFKLYSNLSNMTTDATMKDTFIMLANQEAKHKLRLEMIYDEEILVEN